MKYNVGDNVVHLSHGVGVITGIEERCFGTSGNEQRFYIMEIHDNGAPKKVFVPVDTADIRLRPIISADHVDQVYKVLRERRYTEVEHYAWNRRFRAYMEKIHSGDILSIAETLSSITQIADHKELSFGERKLREQAFQLIVTELMHAENLNLHEVTEKVNTAIRNE